MYNKRIVKLIFIVLFSAMFCASCGCPKDFHIIGMVTDSAFNPLEGVEVILSSVSKTITLSDGSYKLTIAQQITLEGIDITFRKAGYSTVVSQPFTVAEVGTHICDTVNLRRDAVLF